MTIRVTWKRFVMLLAGAGLLGLAVAWSGVFNVAASSGHWAVTDWFLHWVMQNSVRTYSLGIEAPPLDDPAKVRRGAGHYATGCAPCHGAPGESRNPVVMRQTPHPPALTHLGHWEDRELFWIVKHGVKFTAMPAWPAEGRDDEVWAVVAFLRAMQDMDEAAYRDLAFGTAGGRPDAGGGAALDRLSQPAESALADCARCHRRDGNGHGEAAFPVIAGQGERYLREALDAYAAGRRHSGFMQPAAHRVGGETRAALAAHFAAQRPADAPRGQAPDAAVVEAGAAIARDGLPAQGVPACLACHDRAARDRNPGFPRLDGQPAAYLETQLRLWREGHRGGGPYAKLMELVAKGLEPDQAEAVAAYFSTR